MMITSVGECLCVSMCGETLLQTLFEWERPTVQSIHIVDNTTVVKDQTKIKFREFLKMAMMIIVLKKVNEDYDDRHHDENGDGVHPWYQTGNCASRLRL